MSRNNTRKNTRTDVTKQEPLEWKVTRDGERMRSVRKKWFGLITDVTTENEKVSVKGNRRKTESNEITIRTVFGFLKYVKHKSLWTYEYEMEEVENIKQVASV